MSIILHIPHDSTHIPDEYRDDFALNNDALEKEIITMTDMHTDDLYHYDGAQKIIFPVSRLLLDPERFANDAEEIMAQRGMGVLYEVTSALKPLRPKLPPARREELLNRYYHPHHDRLTKTTQDQLSANGQCLIIDCHSFPAYPLPYEMAENNDIRAEICIGADDFHTPAWITETLHDFFAAKGYSVSINDPFAGALVPMDFYRQNASVMSVMFEIRRDLYMNEKTGTKNNGFAQVKIHITEAISLLDQKL